MLNNLEKWLTPLWKTFPRHKQLFDTKVLLEDYNLSVRQKLLQSDLCNHFKNCTKHGRLNLSLKTIFDKA